MADTVSHFRPKQGVLELFGMTKTEFDLAVIQAFSKRKKRDCHESIHTLPLTLKGRRYLLEDVATIQICGETSLDRAAREKADSIARNAPRLP